MNINQVARICHETNRAYCISIGDMSQKPWDEAESWQQKSAIAGVEFALANPDVPASAQHDAWLVEKIRDGWSFGFIKDPVKKTHPCFVPYDELPTEQKVKDYLFKAVVSAFMQAENKA